MVQLLNLPPELRHMIWSHLRVPATYITEQQQGTLSFLGRLFNIPSTYVQSKSSLQMLRTCRKFYEEITPYLYAVVVLNCSGVESVIPWISEVGPLQCSSIQHLIVKGHVPGNRQECNTDLKKQLWPLVIKCLPNLRRLTVHCICSRTPSEDVDLYRSRLPGPELVSILENSRKAVEMISRQQPIPKLKRTDFDYLPELHERRFNNVVCSIDESIPPPYIHYVARAFRRFEASQVPWRESPHDWDSVEKILLGLPPELVKTTGLQLSHSFAFFTGGDAASALLCLDKVRPVPARRASTSSVIRESFSAPRCDAATHSLLKYLLRQVPEASFIRLGIGDCDGSFATDIGANFMQEICTSQLGMLDLSFTDNDPDRIARNLLMLHDRCPQLYTLALAVKPIHDKDSYICNDEDVPGVEQDDFVFNRRFVKPELRERYQSFWQALDLLKSRMVKVWEGQAT